MTVFDLGNVACVLAPDLEAQCYWCTAFEVAYVTPVPYNFALCYEGFISLTLTSFALRLMQVMVASGLEFNFLLSW